MFKQNKETKEIQYNQLEIQITEKAERKTPHHNALFHVTVPIIRI